jgi:hypothetical protein
MSRKDMIPVTKKAVQQKVTKLKKQAEAELPPEDLQNIYQALIAISTAHKLLQEGHFAYSHRNAVGVSLAFLEELHKNAVKDAAAHPKKEMIPELVTLLAAQKVADGKATAPTPAN